ncbi:contact-dependent growth inhibition system immunity protein [Nocardioides okcheonensis]|uniref:contact-dependent growth inhibition system immunity protein n=1 Tax=Nocardioides okcheonensis TaxID=2894081 RepID=UPI001E4854CA|nr:contact-dependent growth inhibition system immunity protein [Nocardioides okcheonensis]UFN46402.1 hypothetical protein LN652_09430 [Nocardioides okcheonensis]
MTELRHLMAAYFHQDWMDEYDDSWERAVDDFLDRSPDRAAAAAGQIDALLAEGLDPGSLGRRLNDLGNYRHAGDEPDAYATWLRSVAIRLREASPATTTSQDLAKRLTSEFASLRPLMEAHLGEQENELLPYLLIADIARWAHATMAVDPQLVGDVVDWLEREFDAAAPPEQDLIGLGFVETIPFPPEGAPLLLRLGPSLTRVAREIGILPDGE